MNIEVPNLKGGYAVRDIPTAEWLENADYNEWSGTPGLDYNRVHIFATKEEAIKAIRPLIKAKRKFQKDALVDWEIVKLTPTSVEVKLDVKCRRQHIDRILLDDFHKTIDP